MNIRSDSPSENWTTVIWGEPSGLMVPSEAVEAWASKLRRSSLKPRGVRYEGGIEATGRMLQRRWRDARRGERSPERSRAHAVAEPAFGVHVDEHPVDACHIE